MRFILSVVALTVGIVLFIGGAWLFDWRLGVSVVGFGLAVAALVVDDGETS